MTEPHDPHTGLHREQGALPGEHPQATSWRPGHRRGDRPGTARTVVRYTR